MHASSFQNVTPRCHSLPLSNSLTCLANGSTNAFLWNFLVSWRVLEGLYFFFCWYRVQFATVQVCYHTVQSFNTRPMQVCSPCRELDSNQQLRPEATPYSVVQLNQGNPVFCALVRYAKLTLYIVKWWYHVHPRTFLLVVQSFFAQIGPETLICWINLLQAGVSVTSLV